MSEYIDNLLAKNNFCIMPFVHLCAWPSGHIVPCCTSKNLYYGNSREQDINDILSISNHKLISFRKEFLETDTLPVACSECKKWEDISGGSYRTYANDRFKESLVNLNIDNDTDLLNNLKFTTFDVRFSNICNLKCRYCDDVNSSRIAEEKKVPIVLNKAFDNTDKFFEFFIKNIDNVDELYFCGGEPLMVEEHYKILDILIEHNKTDVKLKYNSNCTNFNFKNKNIIKDYWSKFNDVLLFASVDCMGEELSYIRHGANWETILKNLRDTSMLGNVQIYLSSVITIYNFFLLKDFYNFLVKENIIKEGNVHFHLVGGHDEISIFNFSSEMKDKAYKYINEWRSELKSYNNLVHSLDVFVTTLNQPNNKVISDFFDFTNYYDDLRNEDFSKTFPMLNKMIKNDS